MLSKSNAGLQENELKVDLASYINDRDIQVPTQDELRDLFHGIDFVNSSYKVYFPLVKNIPSYDEIMFLFKVVVSENKRTRWSEIETLFLSLVTWAHSHHLVKTPLQFSPSNWHAVSKFVQRNWKFCKSKWAFCYQKDLAHVPWFRVRQEVLKDINQKLLANPSQQPDVQTQMMLCDLQSKDNDSNVLNNFMRPRPCGRPKGTFTKIRKPVINPPVEVKQEYVPQNSKHTFTQFNQKTQSLITQNNSSWHLVVVKKNKYEIPSTD